MSSWTGGVFLALTAVAAPSERSDPWRYVVPGDLAAGALPLRVVPLESAPPPDVELALEASAEHVRYGQLRFGSLSGTRVAFALIEEPGSATRLYVDRDRDRKLVAEEQIQGDGHDFELELRPRLDGEGKEGLAMRVHLRLGSTTGCIGVATRGWMEGAVDHGGRRLAARRYDGDGNGLFADPQDLLWVDLDGNGVEDPLRELWPYRALLELDEVLHVVRGEEQGTSLALEELRDRGTIRIELQGAAKPAAFAATLASEDGIVVGIDDLGKEVLVPAGRYRVTNLQLTLPDADRGRAWSYVFAEGKAPRTWTVERDALLVLEPCAKPHFELAIEHAPASASVIARPSFTLESGLYLVTCFRGESSSFHSDTGADVLLVGADERLLEEAHSGFA